jgi:hypothetical protein
MHVYMKPGFAYITMLPKGLAYPSQIVLFFP